MRVSDLSLFNSLADSITETSSNLNIAQQQLATGKQVVEPSDGPAAFAEADLLQAAESATNNDGTLATNVQNQLSAASSALAQISSTITSAIASATEGSDGTINASQMATIAQTVQGQLAEVVQSANTNYAGVYLFGGDQTQAAPFSATGAYSGDSGSNSAVFSSGASIPVSFDGQSIVGNNTSGAIGALNSLISALNSGNQSAVAATLPQLNTALQQVASVNASIGTAANNASMLSTNASSSATTLDSNINQVSGANIAQVAMNVQEDSAQVQALVSLASEIGKIPLIDILS
ncbi:MAG TPA: hypothetical protein VMB26_02130 [Candidatus Binataceae bacterium]|nr:hypothetical protein [Candidatus Binataceae bacterium]